MFSLYEKVFSSSYTFNVAKGRIVPHFQQLSSQSFIARQVAKNVRVLHPRNARKKSPSDR